MPVAALHNPNAEKLFKYSHFNPVQTQAFHTVYVTLLLLWFYTAVRLFFTPSAIIPDLTLHIRRQKASILQNNFVEFAQNLLWPGSHQINFSISHTNSLAECTHLVQMNISATKLCPSHTPVSSQVSHGRERTLGCPDWQWQNGDCRDSYATFVGPPSRPEGGKYLLKSLPRESHNTSTGHPDDTCDFRLLMPLRLM
jgi:hypothetical protein